MKKKIAIIETPFSIKKYIPFVINRQTKNNSPHTTDYRLYMEHIRNVCNTIHNTIRFDLSIYLFAEKIKQDGFNSINILFISICHCVCSNLMVFLVRANFYSSFCLFSLLCCGKIGEWFLFLICHRKCYRLFGIIRHYQYHNSQSQVDIMENAMFPFGKVCSTGQFYSTPRPFGMDRCSCPDIYHVLFGK